MVVVDIVTKTWDGFRMTETTTVDKQEFRSPAGTPCVVKRNYAWCGYVAVPPGHPWHGKGYDDIQNEVDVHGGLTYARACSGAVCHVPAPGEPDDVWWIGFDLGHYWSTNTPEFAREETLRLAAQAEARWLLEKRH